MKVIGVEDPDRKKQFKINATPSAMAGFLLPSGVLIQIWNWKVFAYCPDPELNLFSNNPLGKGVAVRSRPVPVFINKWIAVWRRFDFFSNRQGFFIYPLLN